GTVIVLASIIVPHPLEGGDLMALLSVGAGLVVGGGTLGAVLIPGVSLGQSASRGTLRVAVQAALLAGIAGAILGTIHMLGHLDDPSMIGPGVALAYLALFYGTIIAMIAHGWLARAGGGSEGSAGPPVGYSALYSAGALVIVMAIFFGILAVVP
ncbi:MAG: MotA/TolQ/ExbB proton channel family protein, partial [Myxococcota bacterium]|nr:MotA/TolQ/ExbB proton channel family protein [Myxococcota bacterium]